MQILVPYPNLFLSILILGDTDCKTLKPSHEIKLQIHSNNTLFGTFPTPCHLKKV